MKWLERSAEILGWYENCNSTVPYIFDITACRRQKMSDESKKRKRLIGVQRYVLY
jgi:hypothetical protein